MRPCFAALVGPTRAFFQHEVDVCAADPEGADAGTARAGRRPGLQFGAELERARRHVDVRIWRGEIDKRGQFRMRQRQRRLDQAGHARRGVQVAQIAFDGAQRAVVALAGRGGERFDQAVEFDRIAQRCRGAVALDIRHRRRIDVGHRESGGDHFGLPVDTGRREPDFGGAVVVDTKAANDGVDRVIVGERVVEPLQDDNAGAAAENGARGGRVERATFAIGRDHPTFERDVSALLREADRNAARERHVGLEQQQALAGLSDCEKRGRTRALHVDRRPLEVELVGDARREHILQRADQLFVGTDLEVGGKLIDRTPIAQHMFDEVAVVGRASEDADCAFVSGRIVARVLKRFPTAFEENAVLRVGQRGFARAHREEIGVKLIDIFEDGTCGHVAGTVAHIVAERILKFVRRKVTDAIAAFAQVLPQRADVARAGETAGHADDRDRGAAVTASRVARVTHSAAVVFRIRCISSRCRAPRCCAVSTASSAGPAPCMKRTRS